jgi:hypothetical protein
VLTRLEWHPPRFTNNPEDDYDRLTKSIKAYLDGLNRKGALSFFFETYTPTLTGVANLDTVTAYAANYAVIDGGVLVSGKFDANAAAAGALCQFGLSLPIDSDFTAEQDLGGVAFARAVAGQGAAIRADATNNRAMVEWTAADTADRAMSFVFFYRIK